MPQIRLVCVVVAALLSLSASGTHSPVFAQSANGGSPVPAAVESSALGQTRNVHRCGQLYCAGQFTPEDVSLLKETGIQRVISLRTEGEVDWDQEAALQEAGIELIKIPFRSPESLTDEIFDRVRELLGDKQEVTLFHCGSANRVGGVWLAHRVLDDGVELETALEEAKQIGLRTKAYEEKALDYIRRKKKELEQGAASRASINERFLDPDLDVDAFVQRFEIDNREVYACRQQILRAMNLKPGQQVADVGAGTGLYTRLFANHVGDAGWVFAIDISPKFIQHISNTAAESQLANVTSVLCRPDSIDLPGQSVDVAYVCDTYHHFEFPEATTSSIYRSLRPGGELFVVDFERIPGKSREWILGHVRAGKETVREEIESTGFRFVEEVEIPGLDENYFLRFRK
jgi:ubiquinone/menaquinone biosynthesis C-methylase UbiE/protein tyrosine phosphatase (PTP) superfamily phosphohydrolase (DUF442 family)